MKVNEIILEAGIWSGIKGAVQGYRQSQELRKNPVVDDAVSQWSDYTKKLVKAGVDLKDSAQYEAALNKWLGWWINGKGAPAYHGKLTDLNNLTIRQYIAQAIAQGKTLPVTITPSQTISGIPEGYRLEVISPNTGGKYYKTGTQWTNEVGQPVTGQQNIAALEKWADSEGRIKKIESGPRQLAKRVRARQHRTQ